MLINKRQRSTERGSITILTAIFAVLLMLMVGLTIDVSRIYMIRSELQNAADAAALTAARELNGGTGGIDQAVRQAMTVITNNQGLQTKSSIGIASITFAANLNDDPYLDTTAAKGVASTIKFVKVTTNSTSTTILFAARALGSSVSQTGVAVAGMSVELAGVCDFYPAAVGLTNPNPTAGTLMTLKFAQGSGSTAVINNFDYIVLDVDCISGNGDQETARLAAGEPCACSNIGANIHMTPSSNFGNGGSAAGDGMNTRFGVYANGYGNSLVASTFPSDTNATEGITYTQYKNSVPTEGNDRRVVIAPIIAPGTYPSSTDGRILGWGKFFLKNKMYVTNGNCANNSPCGYMTVEYVGKADIGASGTVSCGSGVTTSVLYK